MRKFRIEVELFFFRENILNRTLNFFISLRKVGTEFKKI